MANKVTVFENVQIGKKTGACLWSQTRMTLSEIRKVIQEDTKENPYETYMVYATQNGWELEVEVKV